MTISEPVAWETDAALGPDPEKRRRRIVIGCLVATIAAVSGVIAIWVFNTSSESKFCSGTGLGGGPVLATPEAVLEDWWQEAGHDRLRAAGVEASIDDFERDGDYWHLRYGDKGLEVTIEGADGGYSMTGVADCVWGVES